MVLGKYFAAGGSKIASEWQRAIPPQPRLLAKSTTILTIHEFRDKNLCSE
jgi:hypothetical protein